MQPFRLSALFKSIHIHVNVGERKRRHKWRSFILGCIPNSSLTNFDLWISIVTDWSWLKMKNKNLICNLWESVVGGIYDTFYCIIFLLLISYGLFKNRSPRTWWPILLFIILHAQSRVWPHLVTTHCKYKGCFVPPPKLMCVLFNPGVCLWSPTWSAGQENPGDLSLGLRPGHEQWLHRWVVQAKICISTEVFGAKHFTKHEVHTVSKLKPLDDNC